MDKKLSQIATGLFAKNNQPLTQRFFDSETKSGKITP